MKEWYLQTKGYNINGLNTVSLCVSKTGKETFSGDEGVLVIEKSVYDGLLARAEKLVEALKSYASRRQYQERIEAPLRKGGCPIVVEDIGPCPSGDLAREVLAEWEKK